MNHKLIPDARAKLAASIPSTTGAMVKQLCQQITEYCQLGDRVIG